ncbi:TIM21-domain-containing protein [Gigaspora margarita]|uniref:Mitochondrial import inner membrane translocase subunit Tim21 n=2 Tax=Gigaspora margarita TaxID=4874 RepID=A0A8H4EJM3_GIGMA|nr:TIM21-domain-containing protein [Gigaspora margarita]
MISTILHQRIRFMNSPSIKISISKCKVNLAASISSLKQLNTTPIRYHNTNSLLNKNNYSRKTLNSFNKPFLDCKHRYQTKSSKLKKAQHSKHGVIEREKAKEWSELSTGQKAVRAAKTTTNISVIVIGVGVLGVLLYYIISELFGPKSSTKVFNESLEKIRNNQECQKVLGVPIKGHGNPVPNSRLRHPRARLQDVINTDGTPHRIMQFYVEGSLTHGNALLDMVKDDQGNWVIKYLIVVVPGYGRRIYIEYHGNLSDKEN